MTSRSIEIKQNISVLISVTAVTVAAVMGGRHGRGRAVIFGGFCGLRDIC